MERWLSGGQADQDCLRTGTELSDRQASQVRNVSGLEQGFAVVNIRLSVVLALIRTVLYAEFVGPGDDWVGRNVVSEE